MHHIKVIKDGNVNKVVKEQLVDGVQYVDDEPREGSLNGVTSDGVAKAVAESAKQSMKDMEEMLLASLPIAANTLRFKFSKLDYDPTVAGVGSSGTWKKVSAKFNNVWDWTGSGTSFNSAFDGAFSSSDNLVSVIAAGETSSVVSFRCMFRSCSSLTSVPLFDTSAVTDMNGMFSGCTSLTSVPLFDTSAVKNMAYMCRSCTSLTSVPLFDTSAVTNMAYMFSGCSKVAGGALALYQQASTKSNPPGHDDTFKNCGKDTVTGAAELAQIPASWGGTAP